MRIAKRTGTLFRLAQAKIFASARGLWHIKKLRDIITDKLARLYAKLRQKGLDALRASVLIAKDWTAKKVVTVDIDSDVVRVLEVKGNTVKRWASASLQATAATDEEAADQQQLGKVVKQLMASNDIKADKVILSFGGLSSITRVLPMPLSAEGLISQENIRAMVNEAMPLSEDQLYISWKTINPTEGEQQIFAVAIPRDVMDSSVRSLKKAGINPHIIELKAVALSRVSDKKRAIILNIDASCFDIVLVVNSIPVVTHTTTFQPASVEDAVEQLGTTLEITLDFYNSRHPESALDSTTPLVVTGQLSADDGLMEKLRARIRRDIESPKITLKYPALFIPAPFASNIGAALRSVKNSGENYWEPIDFNLLPQVYRAWRPTAKQMYSVASIIIAIGLLFPLYQVTVEAMSKTAALEAKYTSLNNELQRKKMEIKSREPLQTTIDDYHLITTMGGKFTQDLRLIKNTADKLGVNLELVTDTGKSIKVSCQASSYTTFRQFATSLKDTGRFAAVNPPDEGFPFTTGGQLTLEPKLAK